MTKKYERLYKKSISQLTQEEIVYLNACECLFYGYGFKSLNKCGLKDDVAKSIWKEAFYDMGDDY